MALPTFVDITAKAAGAGADVTPSMPTHQADDILLLFVESANETITLATANGFVEVTDSPQGTGTAGGTNGTRLAIFWKRAASGSESAPTVEGTALNHIICAVASFRGCITSGDPWDVTAGDTLDTTSTDVTVPGDTTTVADCLIVAACSVYTDNNAGQFPNAWSNADLANIASRLNIGTNVGNGGGIGVATGEKASAGAFGSTTTTITNAVRQGRIVIALKPPASGTTYNQNNAGEISPAAALVKQDTKVLSGATSPAGANVKQATKVAAGAVSPSGATVKQLSRALAGTIAPSGAMEAVRVYLSTLSGAITPAGALVNSALKVLAGALSPTGAIVRDTSRALSGAITPAGEVTASRTFLSTLSGTLTSAAALVKQATKVLTGDVTPSGVQLDMVTKVLTGAIGSSGAAATTVVKFQAASGAVSFGGDNQQTFIDGEPPEPPGVLVQFTKPAPTGEYS